GTASPVPDAAPPTAAAFCGACPCAAAAVVSMTATVISTRRFRRRGRGSRTERIGGDYRRGRGGDDRKRAAKYSLISRNMPLKRPLVIVTRKLPDVIETRLMELFDARLNLDDTPFTAAQLKAALAEAHVLVPTVTDRLDDAALSAAGSELKLIASFGTGV